MSMISRIRWSTVLATVWLAGCATTPMTTLYVAPNGNDAGLGAKSSDPFATLTRARDEIRKRKQAGTLPPGGVAVQLAPGTYAMTEAFELQAQDSGTATNPVVYRAARRGTAVLSGGIPLTDWQAVSAPDILKRLDPAAHGHVLVATLSEAVLKALPGFASGFGVNKTESPIALYQDGQRLPIARWPNEGFVKTGECLGNSNTDSHEGRSFTDGVFRFEDPRLTRWIGEPELWFNGLWFVAWADEKIRLKAIDPEARTIALANGHVFGFRKGQDFYAFNAISEIDQPGEWAIDRANRRLYLWPAKDPKEAPIVLARCETLVKAENASNVRFEGLTFEACRQTALTFKKCTAVTVAASTVRHTGGWAVCIDGGARDTVIGCDLYDLGEGGVTATGGDHDTLTPGLHLIENNHIHHIGRTIACYRPGAAVYGVGNAIRYNLIYQTDHQALFFDGNDHLIEYNIVHDVCLHTSDAGPLYACTRDWSKRGTVIRHNLIHAAGDRVGPGDCNGIYLDDHTSGTLVYGNIVSRCGWGIELGGGKDNTVSNNVIVNCGESIGLHSRGIDSFAKPDAARGRESGCFRQLLEKLDLYRSDLWRTRYPAMLAPLDMDPIDAQNAHGNVVRCNALAGSVDVEISNAKAVMRTCTVTNNPVFTADPGFVDLAALDFRFKPDAPVFKDLPDFKPPEFEKMGLYDDPLRASPAVKFGPQATRPDPIMSPLEREKSKIATLFPVGRTAEQPALIQWTGNDTVAQRVSRAELTVDDSYLNLTVINEIDPHTKFVVKQAWGKSDGMELALAVAQGPDNPNAGKPFVLRGYANGQFESVTDGGATATDAMRLAQAVQYSVKIDRPAAWTAQWRIPLAALGVNPNGPLLPILAQMTVFRSSDRSLTRWSQRRARDTWSVQGAYALWLTPFGELGFLPGAKPSVSRIAVSWGNDQIPMLAGKGAENPTWTTSKSRIEAQFGDVSADRWYAYEFEFTPEKDGTVVMELMGTQGTPTTWTAYDDIRVEGAEFTNGDFENVTGDGSLTGWFLPKTKEIQSQFIASKRAAATGTHFVIASHDFRPTQPLRVKGGQKVTVRFHARGVLDPTRL